MHLTINGNVVQFIPIHTFRLTYNLPSEFSVRFFMPKDESHLGHIDGSYLELQILHQAVLASIPASPPPSWIALGLELQQVFHRQLCAINAKIGLKRSEIEYAVVGFGQVIQSFIHRTVVAFMKEKPIESFNPIYQDWLNDSVRGLLPGFHYPYQGKTWYVRILRHAYGRIGMSVQINNQTHYIWDAELSCPAEGFMYGLLRDVIERLAALAGQAVENAYDRV